MIYVTLLTKLLIIKYLFYKKSFFYEEISLSRPDKDCTKNVLIDKAFFIYLHRFTKQIQLHEASLTL